MDETSTNQQIADQICRDFEWNGTKFTAGQFVALLDGNVISVADSLDKALAALREIEPDQTQGMLFEVCQPVVDVIR